ncbi:MAG: hypothetical protein O3A14_12555 [Cyanobacteria bacterium]|nr:hypothetical protein [Cyanobacteriota bacterium]
MAELPPLDNSFPPLETVPPAGDRAKIVAKPSVEPPATGKMPMAKGLLTWVLRWMLLGAGVSGAWVLGLLVAQFFPSKSLNPPIQEIVLRHSHRTTQKLRQLPQWWSGDRFGTQGDSTVAPLVREPISPSNAPRPIALSEPQREQITVELEAIQLDLQRLGDRTSALETQLGMLSPSESVEQRLQTVANRLNPPTEPVAENGSSEASAPAPAPAAPNPTPTDPLFEISGDLAGGFAVCPWGSDFAVYGPAVARDNLVGCGAISRGNDFGGQSYGCGAQRRSNCRYLVSASDGGAAVFNGAAGRRAIPLGGGGVWG